MDEYESNPHEMALQIPRHLHSQVPQKNDLRGIATASRTGVRRLAQQKESRIEEVIFSRITCIS